MLSLVENIREYLHILDDSELRSVVADLPVHDLVDIWDSLEEDEAYRIFLLLDLEKKVRLITSLSAADQEFLIRSLPLDNIRRLFDQIEPDDLADIIQAAVPEVRESVWHSISNDAREETKFLLRFDADDAAGLMTPRYLAVRSFLTVGQALSFIRATGRDVETVYYIYVVDRLKRIEGVISLKNLLFHDDDAPVEEIMVRQVITVREDTDQEEAARILGTYDLIALPVVDEYNRLLGIITFDDVIDVIRNEQTEDVYKMGAMDGSLERYTESSVLRLVKKRIPWLIILLVAGTVTTNVVSLYQPIIAVAAFLVWFVPVITQTGGNTSLQSSTLMIRGLATGEVHFRDIGKVVLKEVLVSTIMGIVLGGVLVLRGLLLPPGVDLPQAAAIGASLVFVVFFSSIIGVISPLLIHRLGLDPTVMAGPLMATVIDVVGLTIYFQVAALILGL
ncbi:MAG: magnesium transporter [Spirochaetaceae bacterium]